MSVIGWCHPNCISFVSAVVFETFMSIQTLMATIFINVAILMKSDTYFGSELKNTQPANNLLIRLVFL